MGWDPGSNVEEATALGRWACSYLSSDREEAGPGRGSKGRTKLEPPAAAAPHTV